MRKTKVILGALLALAMTACEKDEGLKLQNNEFSITATRESNEDKGADTRATISSAKLSWSAGESITVWDGSNFEDLKTQEGGESATFTGKKITPTSYAVYPHNLKPTYDGSSTLTVTLPDTYEGITETKEGYKSGEAYPPMLATISTPGATSLYFENLGGLVIFNVTGLPQKYTQFVFKTTNDMPITGEFTVAPADGKNVIKSATSAGTAANTVTFKFANTVASNDMVFYVPLPVLDGSDKYEFSIDFMDSEDNTLFTTPKKGWVKIERSKYFQLDLALGSATGGAEAGTVDVIVTSGVKGQFTLPSAGTVNVTMEANANDVELVYSSEGTHPSKVNINCTGDITGTLTVNLADSHVEVTKGSSVSADKITINALSSSTSSTSLVLGETVKIEDKLTVAKGSAEIKGTVKSVEVQAKDASDTSTDEVTIKVAAGATVEETLSVGQGNVEIAGTVKNVTVAETVAETATVTVASTANISEKLDVAKGSSIEIAGSVGTVEVKSTVGTEATVKVAEGANISTKLDVATGSVEVAGTVKEVAVAASVSNVTIAAEVETVTVAAATSGESSDAAPVVWVAETGSVTTSLTNNNSNTTVVATNTTTGSGTQIANITGSASSITIKTPADYMAEKIKTGGTVSLEDNISGNFTIESGNAVINLNGKKISNKTDDAAVITVNSGATLTINGTGEITHSADGKYVIDNNGTVTINGGTYSGTADLINNAGTLNINKGGVYTPVSGKNIVHNTGTLSVDTGIDLTPVNDKGIIVAYVANETSLNAAINDTNIKEIRLNDNITLSTTVKVARELTLDLAGKTVTPASSWSGSDALIVVNRKGNLTINGDGTINVNNNSKIYVAVKLTEKGEDLEGDVAKLTIENGTFIGYYYAIAGNGTRHNTELTINGGKFSAVCENDNSAIYHPQNGTFNVAGGEFSGYSTAIELRSGTLNISGGTFTATATDFSAKPNGNGTTVIGAALAISQHVTDKDINVNITGGTFKGIYALYEDDLQNETGNVSVNIADGGVTLNGDVYCKHNPDLNFPDYLTFSSASNVKFKMQLSFAPTNYGGNYLEYSVGGGEWKTIVNNEKVAFGGSLGNLRLRGKDNPIGTATSTSNFSRIFFEYADTPVAAFGDIRTLIDYENYKTVNTSNARFCKLFYGCYGLTSAPKLPATDLADHCYNSMFRSCTSLTTAPELPAKILTKKCYCQMFTGCTVLNSVTIKATTRADDAGADTIGDALYDWLNNVSNEGTIYKIDIFNMTENSTSGIPSGWSTKAIN